jgi:hypothetical protein
MGMDMDMDMGMDMDMHLAGPRLPSIYAQQVLRIHRLSPN